MFLLFPSVVPESCDVHECFYSVHSMEPYCYFRRPSSWAVKCFPCLRRQWPDDLKCTIPSTLRLFEECWNPRRDRDCIMQSCFDSYSMPLFNLTFHLWKHSEFLRLSSLRTRCSVIGKYDETRLALNLKVDKTSFRILVIKTFFIRILPFTFAVDCIIIIGARWRVRPVR